MLDVGSAKTRVLIAELNEGALRYRGHGIVDSAGTPMWDSASCIRGTGSQLVTLRRGAPASLAVTWDRRTSLIVGAEGTVPPLLPQARQRAVDLAARNRGH